MSRSKRYLPLAAASALALQVTPAWPFTAEQAATGKAAFAQFCEACHGGDLQLSPTAKLAGPEFLTKWQGQSTNDLVAKMRTTMPPESPGGLPEATYLGLVAYILETNGNRATAEALTSASGAPIRAGAPRTPGGGAAPAEPEPTGLLVAGEVQNFVPLTDQALRNPAAGDWPMLRRDYAASSFSPLRQITPANAGRLQLAWIWPMRDGGTNQPSPLAYRGTIYLNNTGGVVQALDARTGSLIWEQRLKDNVAQRGMALYADKLYMQAAGHLVALLFVVLPAFLRALSRLGVTLASIAGPITRPLQGGALMALVALAALVVMPGDLARILVGGVASVLVYGLVVGLPLLRQHRRGELFAVRSAPEPELVESVA